ncbi:serine/threonine-protein kinase [Aldersonia kunmingensis]|uniref:serine/threonine-protein kinase n=1 Tax=Aldersonia kunmingensis TaxID=408066 RepID=UPI00082CDF17|nr:serine/threonine-protein kinase [Aldersonia kunmingensis]
MVDSDPLTTQRDEYRSVVDELSAAGFANAEEIGRGGFGVVYRCVQRELARTVAVKVLVADLGSDNLDRFVREQMAMGALSGHPHIVNIFQVGATPSGRPYIVMQFHPHGSLEAQVRHGGPIGWEDALHVGIKLAGALETAHGRGMLHRDIKPGNILLDEYGEPQLTDFGIARVAGGFETTDGAVTGSPAYTAPEVLRGESPGAASDVYGLASTLFSAATGHAVFERLEGEQMVAQFLRITRHPMPDLSESGLPADVAEVLEQAMSRDLGTRPESAAAFGEQLRELQRVHGIPVDEMAVPIAPTEIPVMPTFSPSELRTGYLTAGYASAKSTPPPVPATRFLPPVSSREMVARSRLIDVLRTGQDRKLTVIHGPTGFGKSTLAAQWCETLRAEGVSVAWLTVGTDDNNVVWFLSHLTEAIRSVSRPLAAELMAMLEEHGEDAQPYVLSALINAVHRSGTRMTLVVDDWHLVTSDATIGAMRYLLDNLCSGLRLLVTGRNPSGLPLSRLRMMDEVAEIDTAALRFDSVESQRFMELCGVDLDRGDVEELSAKTDGWVAAMQLAALSLRGAQNPARLIETMTGRHHAIGEFLAENVLDGLDASTRDFLLKTSITERISGELAAALSGVADGQAMLEQVELADLFLHRVDEQWFAYHHLFAEFLRHRLARSNPERIVELRRVAARWFAEHRMVGEAVDQALAAGDEEEAVRIVEDDGRALLEQFQMATLIGLIGKLPASAQTRPKIQLALAWATVMLHRPEGTKHALGIFESTLGDTDATADQIADLRIEADVVRAVILRREDRVGDVDHLLAPALAQPERMPPLVICVAANTASLAATYRGDLDEVHRLQALASPHFRRSAGTHSQVYGLCINGLAAWMQLELDESESCYREALRIARRSGSTHAFTARLASVLLGELVYERGDLVEAERLLDEGYRLGPETGTVEDKIARFVTGARIKLMHGDRGAAMQRLDDGARVARELSLPRLRALVENERLRLGMPPNPDYAPQNTAFDARREPVDEVDVLTVQAEEATAIRRLLAEHDPDSTRLACRWAQQWVDQLAPRRLPRGQLLSQRLLVACLSAAGRDDEAKLVLANVLARCAKIGALRFPIDGGPYVVATLAELIGDHRVGAWSAIPADFIDRLDTALRSER